MPGLHPGTAVCDDRDKFVPTSAYTDRLRLIIIINPLTAEGRWGKTDDFATTNDVVG